MSNTEIDIGTMKASANDGETTAARVPLKKKKQVFAVASFAIVALVIGLGIGISYTKKSTGGQATETSAANAAIDTAGVVTLEQSSSSSDSTRVPTYAPTASDTDTSATLDVIDTDTDDERLSWASPVEGVTPAEEKIPFNRDDMAMGLSEFKGPLSEFIVAKDLTRISTTSSSNGKCKNNGQSLLWLELLSDKYPWENSWVLEDKTTGETIASGPPANTNYARLTKYTGRLCLDRGQYRLTIRDRSADGICCNYGKGSLKAWINGKMVARTNHQPFAQKKWGFVIQSSQENQNPTPTPKPTARQTRKPTSPGVTDDEVTFRRGDLTVEHKELGIKMCTGMSVRVIAKAGEGIQILSSKLSSNDGTSASTTTSEIPFHSMADGAAVFPLENTNGYVYISNSEMAEKMGGVYGMYFDSDGNIIDYKQLLSDTTRNCGGGVTPWDTWVSCEEYANGQCWQVDPTDQVPPQITQLGGSGGKYESVAVDNRNEEQPIFFVTEDLENGALRKYTPPVSDASSSPSWDTIHVEGGTTEFLLLTSGNEFEWTTDEEAARSSQCENFSNAEGIDYHDGKLYFVSKWEYLLYVLDLDNGTYTSSSTEWGMMANGGAFENGPDQLVRNHGGEYLYLTEDGGDTAGVYAIHKATGKRHAIFEADEDSFNDDETTGLAFSPDGTKMYAAFQDCGCDCSGYDFDCGCLMEFSRDDGRSFDGSTLELKYHTNRGGP